MRLNDRHRRTGIGRGGVHAYSAGAKTIRSDRLLLHPAAVLAALLLLAAVVCALFYAASPKKQAGLFLQDLYTINQYQGVDEAVLEEFPGMYKQKYGRRMTDHGIEAAMSLQLPYGLLMGERPVDRTYAQVTFLKEKPGGDTKTRQFSYELLVETHLIREDEAVQPVLKQMYTGTVSVKKSGWFRWKLDDITSGELL